MSKDTHEKNIVLTMKSTPINVKYNEKEDDPYSIQQEETMKASAFLKMSGKKVPPIYDTKPRNTIDYSNQIFDSNDNLEDRSKQAHRQTRNTITHLTSQQRSELARHQNSYH